MQDLNFFKFQPRLIQFQLNLNTNSEHVNSPNVLSHYVSE